MSAPLLPARMEAAVWTRSMDTAALALMALLEVNVNQVMESMNTNQFSIINLISAVSTD